MNELRTFFAKAWETLQDLHPDGPSDPAADDRLDFSQGQSQSQSAAGVDDWDM